MSATLLHTLTQTGALRTIDHALAQSLRRLDPDTPDLVLAAAALASLAVSRGHAGFLPAQPQLLLDADIDWPPPEDWHAQLQASPWVATPDDPAQPADAQTPLVLEGPADGQGLLYLRRYREYEHRLALGLQRIGAHTPDAAGLATLAPLFGTLFPAVSLPLAEGGASGAGEGTLHQDRQAQAAALALRHHLLLVTGSPGTGKTTTITRLLVLLAAQARQAGRPAPRIALAAPTGRAAERMAESVRNALQALAAADVDPALLAQLPTTGTTLHRLLGTIPDSPRFRHHADNPLPLDIVVVDEASMIDLPLMAKLVDAVADGARLVLLGDPDQLPSVEAGDVLSGILRAAGDGSRIADDDAAALHLLLGNVPVDAIAAPASTDNHASVRTADADTSPVDGRGRAAGAGEGALRADHLPRQSSAFPGRRIHLQRGYRQHDALQLAPLAEAVREGDASHALALLRGGTLSNVHFHENLADPLQAHRAHFLAHWRALADAANPAAALALANRLRILTALREGPQGARGLNARIGDLLTDSGTGAAANRYFHGRLLLVTENSYRHRLFNGDIGICFADDSGAVMAWFPGDDPAAPRPFHPAALPAHESAFAMTVHKAQGSEFDEVWLVLPARPNRVLSRELVYTGITRARSALHLACSEDVLRDALGRHAGRWSGLGWRLGARPGEAPRASTDTGDPPQPPAQGTLF
ncbi:AAA family ATPase [Luteimonas sp. BDR2-5]|uniref:AAA family ATPase n=1 Tax=Proluteimonas luteida TaxID=2878685 RepID=UPI001E42A8CD|nr:AAA family ATPase [Luteimonas sp. BDR2-5]MCD9029025.1 AAA family ATPase [Luteimonas sp. BDR2-5]